MRILLLAPLCLACAANASDWPQFRGPDANGIAPAAGAPEVWDEATNIAWTVDVPGEGWSAPIVVGDRVLLTTTVPTDADPEIHRFEVRCFNLSDGSERWTRVARAAKPTQPKHRDNTWASETPLTDGERVYAYFGMNGVYCFTLDGEPVWEADPGSYPMDHDWGASSAPAYDDGKLFLQIDNKTESFMTCLDAADGTQLWRVERPDEVSNWSSPIVWKNSDRTEVVAGGKTVRSYDPATGAELWAMEIGGRSSATPSAIGDLLYVGSEDRSSRGGTPGGLFAVRAGATGDIDVTDPAAPGLAWANLRGAVGIASPLVFGGQVYVPERRGDVMRTHNVLTGEQTNRKRLPGRGVFWGSPLAIGGRVYALDDQGTMFILAPGPELEVVRTNELPGRFWSTPAVSGDALLIRSEEKLYCIRQSTGA